MLVVGGVFWWKRKDLAKNSVSNNKEDYNKKENLASKIKNDLKERINRIKNSKGKPDTGTWAAYMDFDDRIVCVNPGGIGDFLKEKESVFLADIGLENYQEIINLINQARRERKEWGKRRNQEYQQRVANNPNLFYCPVKSTFEYGTFFRDETTNWDFSGKQNGKHYDLIIPLNHPNLANIPIENWDYNFYLITGVENIPLVPSPMDGTGLYKIIKPEDKITIKLIEN